MAPWKKLNDICYYVNTNSYKTWEEARHTCDSLGGKLMFILNHNEENTVNRMLFFKFILTKFLNDVISCIKKY